MTGATLMADAFVFAYVPKGDDSTPAQVIVLSLGDKTNESVTDLIDHVQDRGYDVEFVPSRTVIGARISRVQPGENADQEPARVFFYDKRDPDHVFLAGYYESVVGPENIHRLRDLR